MAQRSLKILDNIYSSASKLSISPRGASQALSSHPSTSDRPTAKTHHQGAASKLDRLKSFGRSLGGYGPVIDRAPIQTADRPSEPWNVWHSSYEMTSQSSEEEQKLLDGKLNYFERTVDLEVQLQDGLFSRFTVRALIDAASEYNLISKEAAQRLAPLIYESTETEAYMTLAGISYAKGRTTARWYCSDSELFDPTYVQDEFRVLEHDVDFDLILGCAAIRKHSLFRFSVAEDLDVEGPEVFDDARQHAERPREQFQSYEQEPHVVFDHESVSLQDELNLQSDAILSEEDASAMTSRVFPEFDWSGRGQFHIDSLPEQEIPLTVISVLGSGSSAHVEAVSCREKVLARKTIFVHRTRNELQQRRDIFREIDIMRRLRHPHVVRVVGSYMSGRTVRILMTPVCESNLADFMEECRQDAEIPTQEPLARRNRSLLEQSMKCLAQALKYVHDQSIRHKDIKPTNILVRTGSDHVHVYFTDFGLSHDFSDAISSTTTGLPNAFTRKYASPELLDYDARNTSSDVFSLGCVFLEMQSVVMDVSLPVLQYPSYASCLDQISRFIEEELLQCTSVVQGQDSDHDHLQTVLGLMAGMLSVEPSLRPTASRIAHVLGSNVCCHVNVEQPTDEASSRAM